MEKIKIGVSSCLLGEKVRYDAGHKLDRYNRIRSACILNGNLFVRR